PQEETRATYAPKITRETARIRWDAGPDAVMRATLALDPKPGAWTTLNGQEIKLFHAHVGEGIGTSGTVLRTDDRFVVAAGAGAVVVEEVQPTGKSRMTAAEWIRGRGVAVGQQFV
ncbi:MAG: methionyl-tRNA formyltransferase, partial [Gemmatimonadetes bacterium]